MTRLVAVAFACLFAGPALAGCFGGDDTPPPTGPTSKQPAALAFEPWWPVGAYWDLELKRGSAPVQKYRVVNMWNDSDTSHFWLGVKERELALDHALYDTNPFLGRIHHNILAPHEKGMHATMYSFPLRDGKQWTGSLLEGDWEFKVAADAARPGVFVITGRGADGSTIVYDYDPATKWFTSLRITDSGGRTLLDAKMAASGTGSSGSYFFHRGRDYYAGPEIKQGTHTETVAVNDAGLSFLALRFDLTADQALEVQLADPSGQVRHRESLGPGGGSVSKTVEVAAPQQGDWTLRYVTTGTLGGTVLGIGVFETKKDV